MEPSNSNLDARPRGGGNPPSSFKPPSSKLQVVLPTFEGPLDLLLHLIERQELDITQISLVRVTDQFLEAMAQVTERNPELLADFLVVAAKLLLLKSRALLPQPQAPLLPEEEEETGEELVRQLLEYKKFKAAAGWLREIEAQGLASFVRLPSEPLLDRTIDLGGLTLDDLLVVARQSLVAKPPGPSVNGTIPPLPITVADQMELIARETARREVVSLVELMKQATSRLEVIVTLLAALEMVKERRITMRQDRLFGDIWLSAVRANGGE